MAGLKYKASDGTYKPLTVYNVTTPDVVQTTGTEEGSEKAVMSQSAVTTEFQKYVTKTSFNETITGYSTTGDVETVKSTLNTHTGNIGIHVNSEQVAAIAAVSSKANISDLTAHTANTEIHVTSEDKEKWNAVSGKAESNNVYTKGEVYTKDEADGKFQAVGDYVSSTTLSDYSTTVQMNSAINDAVAPKANSADLTAHTADKTIHVTANERSKWNAVSGKADSSDVYTKTEIDNKGYLTEHQSLTAYSTTSQVEAKISAATSGKADSSTVTSLNNSLTDHTTNGTIHVTAGEKSKWDAKAEVSAIPTNVSQLNNDKNFITYAKYDDTAKTINFYADSASTAVVSINAADFVKDGMVNSASVSGSNLVIVFNTDAGKDPITIPISSIFNADNYYSKTDANSTFQTKGNYVSASTLGSYYTKQEVNNEISKSVSGKTNTSDFTAHTSNTTVHITAGERTTWNTVTNKANSADVYSKDDVDSKLGGKSNTGHTHEISGVTGLQAALNKKSNTGHTHTIAEVTDLQSTLNGKSNTDHTHNYAGSSSAGGAANSAVTLTTNAGSATKPVYFTGGKPAACSYTLETNVPSNAVFTDTHYESKTIVANASTATTDGTAANGNVYLNHIENGAIKSTHKIVGAGATTVTSDASGNITISSTNTTYGVATTSADGLMSSTDKSKLNGIAEGADAVSFTRNLTSGTKIGTININGTNTDLYCETNTNTTYSAGAGIGLNDTQFYNTGVRSISAGTANGTISVNTNGTAADVAVKGLGSAAYTNSNAYAAASHNHNYAGSSSAGGAATSANKVANALTLQFNDTTNQTYDGSAAKTFNVTPSAIGALPTAAQQFSAVSTTQSVTNATCPFTFTADGQNGTVMYYNSGSANVTITVSTNYKTPTTEQLNITIVPGGYGEVNYLRFNSNMIVARGL